jgi:hypothetical protein
LVWSHLGCCEMAWYVRINLRSTVPCITSWPSSQLQWTLVPNIFGTIIHWYWVIGGMVDPLVGSSLATATSCVADPYQLVDRKSTIPAAVCKCSSKHLPLWHKTRSLQHNTSHGIWSCYHSRTHFNGHVDLYKQSVGSYWVLCFGWLLLTYLLEMQNLAVHRLVFIASWILMQLI